jgi:hypothetical protein
VAADTGESLAFHASAPGASAEGYVLLLGRGDAPDRVRCRRWESPDYMAAAVERLEPAGALRAEVRRQAQAGWRFTLPPDRILAWLEGDPRR